MKSTKKTRRNKMNSQQQGGMNWATVAGFSFALGGMIAVDMTNSRE